MRILYITDQIYLHGGAEKILIQKLNYWADVFRYEVLLVTTQQEGKKPFFALSDKVKWKDLDMGYAEGKSFFHPQNLKRFPDHFSKLKKTIDDFKPDGIFLISLGFARFVLPWAAGKYPTFNEYHTSYYGFRLGYEKLSFLGKVKKQILYAVIRFVESFYTGIVFLNQAEFDHYNRKNGVIIPNFFDEIMQPPDLLKKKQAITLGRLSYQKGYDLLIDAWEIVERSAKDWTLEIYGNGENREALNKRIMRKNLLHAIHLNEATDSVNEKLSESSFYVMSSRFETFPMVLLEAMSNKLPVVSFDCPTGPASMLTPGDDGILVKPNDIQALADAMLQLIGDEEKRLQMGARGAINVRRFNPESVMQKWDDLVRRHSKK